MPRIRVLDDGGEIVEQETLSRQASIIYDDVDDIDDAEADDMLQPAIVERVEYDHKGQESSLTTVCGETENRREGDEKPDITVEGILTESQLPEAKQLEEGLETTLVSDVHTGRVYVSRLTIEQNMDVVEYIPDGSDESELAFTFQLQFSQP